MMKAVLLLGIVIVCVLPSLCRPTTDCNKAVLDVITQIRSRLDELESVYRDGLDPHRNKSRHVSSLCVSSRPYKSRRHNKRGKKHGSHYGKVNQEQEVEEKVFEAVEITSTTEPTTIDYTTETMEMIVSTEAENFSTSVETIELSGEFTDNPTTLSN